MRRSVIALFVTALLATTLAAPAGAITFGQRDGNRHPNVGSIVVRFPDSELFQWCSGTLISEDVFLTASHCTAPLDSVVEEDGGQVLVTFDSTIQESGKFYTGTWVTNPSYNNFRGKFGVSDPGDIAVILLHEAPAGITPARLPTAGMLDQLKRSGVLRKTRFTAVGYGMVRDTMRKGFQAIEDNVDRNFAEQGFNSLTNAWLTLAMNQTPWLYNGCTCYGDSGVPHFIHLNGAETNIVASITVTGDAPCVATDKTYRTDTPSARTFLRHYVDLP
ncbi:MAG: S1 family peptidase [Chloroflexota bacterium]|nr:S1 family peptidase [Chloroflexota bacterium]